MSIMEEMTKEQQEALIQFYLNEVVEGLHKGFEDLYIERKKADPSIEALEREAEHLDKAVRAGAAVKQNKSVGDPLHKHLCKAVARARRHLRVASKVLRVVKALSEYVEELQPTVGVSSEEVSNEVDVDDSEASKYTKDTKQAVVKYRVEANFRGMTWFNVWYFGDHAAAVARRVIQESRMWSKSADNNNMTPVTVTISNDSGEIEEQVDIAVGDSDVDQFKKAWVVANPEG